MHTSITKLSFILLLGVVSLSYISGLPSSVSVSDSLPALSDIMILWSMLGERRMSLTPSLRLLRRLLRGLPQYPPMIHRPHQHPKNQSLKLFK
ncbi:hypothetical protein DFH05DRAFT_1497626 [Lentinula detonsa]|uniref:Secreted protein n=1 Tax=Lentinula detonsa TaxID=2804962 RepID=A0A9W8TX86_9AGAR|nr:hypothetical protein DFH05DRAFT_1497626 [Lentinula detonsa]